MDGAAVVIGRGAQMIQRENIDSTRRIGRSPVHRVPTDLIERGRGAGGRDGVIEIDEVIGIKVGIVGDPDQAALAIRIHVERKHRRRQHHPVHDQAHHTGFHRHEQLTVRQDVHRRRRAESTGHDRLGKTAGQHSE